MDFKLWLESTLPEVYHQTSMENAKKIMRYGFNFKNALQNIIWFTNNLDSLYKKETGASAHGAILKLSVDIKKAAGWKEYDAKLLDQLEQEGYDGVILPEKEGFFNGFIFNPKKIKVLGLLTLHGEKTPNLVESLVD